MSGGLICHTPLDRPIQIAMRSGRPWFVYDKNLWFYSSMEHVAFLTVTHAIKLF
jgi:hypothetical protein